MQARAARLAHRLPAGVDVLGQAAAERVHQPVVVVVPGPGVERQETGAIVPVARQPQPGVLHHVPLEVLPGAGAVEEDRCAVGRQQQHLLGPQVDTTQPCQAKGGQVRAGAGGELQSHQVAVDDGRRAGEAVGFAQDPQVAGVRVRRQVIFDALDHAVGKAPAKARAETEELAGPVPQPVPERESSRQQFHGRWGTPGRGEASLVYGAARIAWGEGECNEGAAFPSR